MKIRQRQTDEPEALCTVTGRFLMADGSPYQGRLLIAPERAGHWRGIYYSDQPVVMKPDSEGIVKLQLPPSSVMGRYSVESKPPGIVLSFTVPDSGTVDMMSAA